MVDEAVLEAVAALVGVDMEDRVAVVQEEADPVAVEVEDTLHLAQQTQVTNHPIQPRSSMPN